MHDFYITGIQQVGIGTEDLMASWKWYADLFQMNIRVVEDVNTADLMAPYTDNVPQKRHACVVCNLQGGGGFHLLQFTQRKPIPPVAECLIGDLGIFMTTVKSHDIEKYHEEIASKWREVSSIAIDPRGIPTFYVHDPFGNCFQVIEDNNIFLDENRLSGGVVGVVIGVSDMERSLSFYSDVLGYDKVLYDKNGVFTDWQTLRGGDQHYRRILLGRTEKHTGPFSDMFGAGAIELVQCLDREPQRLFEGRMWGDSGFCQVGFDVVNMEEFKAFCESKGYKFTIDSSIENNLFGMGKASAHFSCLEDPDGTLIELVEAYKLPVVDKLNMFVDLMKRDRTQPLPRTFFHIMKLNRVKFN